MKNEVIDTQYFFNQELLYIANELENRFEVPPKEIYYSCYEISTDSKHIPIIEIILFFDADNNFRISLFLEKTTNFSNISQKQLTQSYCLEISITTLSQSFHVLHTFLEHWSLNSLEATDTGGEPCLRFY